MFVEADDAMIVPASPRVSRDKRRILAVERDAVARAVEGHVERSRSGRHGVDRAAAAGRRELNHIGKAL